MNKCRPENKKKLNIKKKLDKLDNNLLRNCLKKEQVLVKEVLKLKKYKSEIIDKKRINFILKKIKKNHIKSNIDPKITK